MICLDTLSQPALAETLYKALFDAAAEKGWRAVSLQDIARKAGMLLSEISAIPHGKHGILMAFLRQMNQDMLRGIKMNDSGETARDRLFEAIMNRVDAMQPYKEGLAAMVRDLVWCPATAALVAVQSRETTGWLLAVSGQDKTDMRLGWRHASLLMLLTSTARAWLKDTSPDLTHTMKALDSALDKFQTSHAK